MGQAMWRTGGLAAVLLLGVSGCAANPAPGTEAPRPEPAAQETSDETVAAAAREEGMDPDSVVRSRQEAQRRVERLDPVAEAEFARLFGDDPLGLARVPGNAERYEIPLEMNEKVQAWIDYFQNVIPERFQLYLDRAARYEGMIREKLGAAAMPEDLLYLALIESGMNPNAYSRAHAVGMWQFIRSTGALYDLEASYWLDDRRDFVKATDAAIAHLRDLHDEFGSWYLAAAAYNGGSGRVRRGLASTGATDFWGLAEGRALRAETRNYVPKLLAAAIIGQDPEAYGFRTVDPDPLRWDEVEVPDATSLDVIAEAAGTEEEVIKSLNPQFVRNVTPPDRRVTVRVPAGTGVHFAAQYAKIPPSERVTWLVHTVTRGETLSRIASRYGTTVAAVRAANGGVHPRRLQIGQRLVVPREGRSSSTALASANRSQAARSGPLTVTVRRGDTLWSIARRHNVTTSQLVAWNNLASTVIRPGDRLTIR